MYLFIVKNHIHDSLTPVNPASFGISRSRLPDQTWDALFWVQIFHTSNHLNGSGFALDEAARGVKHMLSKNEIPIWVTFAMQIHLDLGTVFGDDQTLAAPFREYQDTVRKRELQFGSNDRNVRTFLEARGTTKVGPL
ncbi:hypothetical protein CC86DRAFT_438954 [Ophiobolus disseminans]|uniref:Uncharacterized protein n=1 Tax=Ophiobolus disseminans TaxID=1469910 RepID=A0A6A7A410_9PLEO|nr:hypothetical protein CC86DRAFT_438954 [Ophiobolus disseminans]